MTQLMQRLMVGVLALGLAATAAAVDPWTGGVSEMGREQAPAKNTRIEFFVSGGPYLADVTYTLYDDRGNVLAEGVADGPWVLVDLQSGTYSVKATRNRTGETESSRFFVETQGKTVVGLMFDR